MGGDLGVISIPEFLESMITDFAETQKFHEPLWRCCFRYFWRGVGAETLIKAGDSNLLILTIIYRTIKGVRASLIKKFKE